jgi:guanylate kinase
MQAKGRLLILTGPSCAGKSPLLRALREAWPERMDGVRPLVLYNSRAPRSGERDGVDYHFRRREEIEAMRGGPDRVVMEVRGDLQALDIAALGAALAQGAVFYEGNPFIAGVLCSDARMRDIPRRSLFVSPISLEEIRALQDPAARIDTAEVVTDLMRRKLLRRARRQKGQLALPDLEEAERRARSAWSEIRMAPRFDAVVVNPDGEDSENWDAFPLVLGAARRALIATEAFLFEGAETGVERWPEGVLDVPAGGEDRP